MASPLALVHELEQSPFRPLALRIQEAVRAQIPQVYLLRPRVPEWVGLITTDLAITQALVLAQGALKELKAPPNLLLETSPHELATYWNQFIRDNYEANQLREPVSVRDTVLLLARQCASGVFQNHRNHNRYVAYLQYGAPPGVQSYPELCTQEKTKTLEIDWDYISNRTVPARWMLYRSERVGIPRRRRNPRSTFCGPSPGFEYDNPQLFT